MEFLNLRWTIILLDTSSARVFFTSKAALKVIGHDQEACLRDKLLVLLARGAKYDIERVEPLLTERYGSAMLAPSTSRIILRHNQSFLSHWFEFVFAMPKLVTAIGLYGDGRLRLIVGMNILWSTGSLSTASRRKGCSKIRTLGHLIQKKAERVWSQRLEVKEGRWIYVSPTTRVGFRIQPSWMSWRGTVCRVYRAGCGRGMMWIGCEYVRSGSRFLTAELIGQLLLVMLERWLLVTRICMLTTHHIYRYVAMTVRKRCTVGYCWEE
jgi:hypothetical protein